MNVKRTAWRGWAVRLLLAAMALLAAARLAPVAAQAQAGPAEEYYMVEGRIYAEGYSSSEGLPAEITKVQVVDGVPRLESHGGEGYALVSLDASDTWLGSVNLNVSFAPVADAGGEAAAFAVFTALVPCDEAIAGFAVYSAAGDLLADIALNQVLSEITYFDVEDTGEGYRCAWDVALAGGGEEAGLVFDLVAVSAESGEANMLAYQVAGYEVTVPYAWLYPGDTVYFRLLCYDGATRLVASSDEFATPEGEDDTVAKDDPWYEREEEERGGEDNSVWALLLLVPVALVAGAVVLVVMLVRKRKKQ